MLERSEFETPVNAPDHGRAFQVGERRGRVSYMNIGERHARTTALVITIGDSILAGVDFDPGAYPTTAEQVQQSLELLADDDGLDQLVQSLLENRPVVLA